MNLRQPVKVEYDEKAELWLFVVNRAFECHQSALISFLFARVEPVLYPCG